MTTTSSNPAPAGDQAAPVVETITATIDGYPITVPKGTLIIRAAELMGLQIPRFCDHPLLDPVAMCRMCLVEVAPGPPKPQPACAIPLADGMAVKTQFTSAMADDAQQGVMEFILANHPLDCPICDKGGECPLQNQAMSNGRGETRFTLPKSTFDKPIPVSSQVLLDRERCVNCARCTRFADQIAGDPFIALLERGGKQQVGISTDQPFDSYFSGNTIQICPVGALTSAVYRFRSRPFDLVSVPTTCEHCASGCALRTDYRRDTVMRRQAWDDPDVNEEWNCDKGRFAFPYLTQDRLPGPLIREDGELRPASWPEAIDAAARGLAGAHGRAAALLGGRLTLEDAFAYQALLRGVLGSDDIDFRARAASAEEAGFLAAHVAGTGLGVTYADLEKAPAVVLVAFEPEEESPIVFLRLRKAVRHHRQAVHTVAAFRSRGASKLGARLLAAGPGQEASAVAGLAAADSPLRQNGAVVLVGERAAEVPGLLTAVADVAALTGARLAWVPRRAGERGAVDAGALPGLLPGGRPVTDPTARAEYAAALNVAAEVLPTAPGRDLAGIIAAIDADAAAGATRAADEDPEPPSIGALIVGGVDPADVPDAAGLRRALAAVPFLVSLEQRPSEVTALADVVLPVAAVTEKAGTFVDWEGRSRRFGQVFRDSVALSDARVIAMIADGAAAELDLPVTALGRGDLVALRDALAALPAWTGPRSGVNAPAPAAAPSPAPGSVRLVSWRLLLDDGAMQAGEPHLAGTAKPSTVVLSAATAAAAGVSAGEPATLATATGTVTLPVEIAADMVDGVAWVPRRSVECDVYAMLGAGWGDPVRLGPGGAA